MTIKDRWRHARDWAVGQFRDDGLLMTKPQKMQYEVKDSLWRDIYARDHERSPGSKLIVWVIPGLVILLYLFLTLIVFPFLMMALHPVASGHYWRMVFWLYCVVPGGFGGLLRGILWIGAGVGLWLGVKVFAEQYWRSQNVDNADTLLDQYKDDSRLQQPEELPENFDIFPDVGAHSKHTKVTAILGHMMLTNKGVDPQMVVLRADGKTDRDEQGEVINRNLPYYDDNDQMVKELTPLIDEDFGEKLWDSAGIPRPRGRNAKYIRNTLRRRYDPVDLMYNPTHRYGKSNEETVAERINNDWYFPDYEVQRPAGAYIVDTEPNNTMV